MTALNEPILLGSNIPDTNTIKQWTINGYSDVIQEKLKSNGWNGETQVASVALTQDDEGKITGSQVVLSGSREIGHISANTIWGEPLTQEDYVKIHQMDVAITNIQGRMVSDWVHSNQMDWVLKILNKETNKYRIIDRLSEDALKEKGASKLFFRVHLSLEKGPRISTKLGLAPTDNIINIVGNGAMNFPLIQIGKSATIDILPSEPEGSDWGLGFTPFIVNMGNPDAPPPTMVDIHTAVQELFNNACKPKLHTKFSTWKASTALGSWDPVDPTYYWPSRSQARDQDVEEGQFVTSLF